ncbi:MAG: hypothetical protein K6C10_06370 [Prevotella sp.]|nr:hypothetical protein [Prevotella sp.]
MNIIHRNFFRLLRSGALNEYESLEPMSLYKWKQLSHLIAAQGVAEIAMKGLRNHTFDDQGNYPKSMQEELQSFIDESLAKTKSEDSSEKQDLPHMSNFFLNRRLNHIQKNERHQIDASMTTLDLLNIIVKNINLTFNKGISLSGISEMGSFLRTKGDKVDFVKLEEWLRKLHIQRMAQLEGSVLIAVFKFDQDEIPFVNKIEPKAYGLTLRTLDHHTDDNMEEWHFKQSEAGFVHGNTRVTRRNLRRSMRYISYAPIETSSHFLKNFARNLSEIEE